MVEAVEKPEKLAKELGLFDVYAISTGAMFSSGFFLLPGLAAAQTGPSAPLAYLVAGLFILPAMFAVAELATAMPRAGGAYYFLDRSMGPMVGTVGGLGTWLALVLKSAFALVGMGAYLGIFFDLPIEPIAIALTMLFMVINIVGAKETGGLQRLLVSALLVILAFFIVQGLVEVGARGFGRVTAERFTPLMPFGIQGFFATVGLVFVSYAGLTKVAAVSEEVKDPDRNIPLGMVLSLLTASFVYTVGVYIIVAVLEPTELRDDLTPVATAAQAFFDWLPGDVGLILIVVAAIAAFASTGNAGILSASRFPLAMARDHLVSPRFGKLSAFGTPLVSVVATGGLMVAAIVLLDVSGIAKLASALELLLFSLLNLAVIIMRESRIESYDPGFRSPLYPWMQVFGLVAPFWLIFEMGELSVAFTLGLIALTIGWYFAYGRKRVEREGAIFHTFAVLGERRHGGLDVELQAIGQEKELRETDSYDLALVRALVLDDYSSPFHELVGLAAQMLSRRVGVDAKHLQSGFEKEIRDGLMPASIGAALPHLRVPGAHDPELLLVRSREGIAAPPPDDMPPSEAPRVHAIFFLVSSQEIAGQHLRLLGHLATRAEEPGFVEKWLAASDELELKATLLRTERLLTVLLRAEGRMSEWVGRRLRDIEMPAQTLIAMIRRSGQSLVPSGSTTLETGDQLTVVGDPKSVQTLARMFGQPEPTGS